MKKIKIFNGYSYSHTTIQDNIDEWLLKNNYEIVNTSACMDSDNNRLLLFVVYEDHTNEVKL